MSGLKHPVDPSDKARFKSDEVRPVGNERDGYSACLMLQCETGHINVRNYNFYKLADFETERELFTQEIIGTACRVCGSRLHPLPVYQHTNGSGGSWQSRR